MAAFSPQVVFLRISCNLFAFSQNFLWSLECSSAGSPEVGARAGALHKCPEGLDYWVGLVAGCGLAALITGGHTCPFACSWRDVSSFATWWSVASVGALLESDFNSEGPLSYEGLSKTVSPCQVSKLASSPGLAKIFTPPLWVASSSLRPPRAALWDRGCAFPGCSPEAAVGAPRSLHCGPPVN